jgi:hypothetical protein
VEERHQLVETAGEAAVVALSDAGVEVESMARAPRDDPAFFLAGGAAGILAGRMAAGSRRWRSETDSTSG